MTPASLPPQQVKLPRRLMIILYDALLLFAVLFFASAIGVMLHRGEAVENSLAFNVYLLGVAFLYYGWFWTESGQTLGMKSWRVRLQQRDGSNITWQQAGIRFAAAILSWLPLGLGFLWMLWDKEGLTWHDRLSDTRLVRLPKPEKKP